MRAPPTHTGDETALPELPPSSPTTAVPHTFRALRHRNFRLFAGGQIISLVGTWMQSVAQSWLVYRLTHSSMLLGTTVFIGQLPVLVLGSLAGVTADRHRRWNIVVATQAASMV